MSAAWQVPQLTSNRVLQQLLRSMDGERIVQVLSWHQVQTAQQLGEALKQGKESGVIPEDQVRLCVVADGPS
jgi:hypothetical protein